MKRADDGLADALRRGEQEAFAQLATRHSARIRRVIRRGLSSDEGVSDLTQEVLLCAMRSAPQFRGNTGQIGAWVAGIAFNVVRSEKRRPRVSTSETCPPPQLSVAPSCPERRQALRRTSEFFARLHPEERQAFSLRVIEGLSLEELAEQTQTSASTAKRRVARARSKLFKWARREAAVEKWSPVHARRPCTPQKVIPSSHLG